jgi:hypothetical protein
MLHCTAGEIRAGSKFFVVAPTLLCRFICEADRIGFANDFRVGIEFLSRPQLRYDPFAAPEVFWIFALDSVLQSPAYCGVRFRIAE